MIKLFRFLAPYRVAVACLLVLLLLQTIADLYLPTLLADIVNRGVVKNDIPYIWRVGGLMLLVTAAGAVCAILASFLSARTATAFGRDVRGKVFSRVEGFSLREFDRFGPATLITRTTNDVTQVQSVTVMIMRMMIGAPITAVGGLILAFSKDAGLSLVLVVALPVLAALIGLVLGVGVPLFARMQVKLDRLNLVARENLTGVRVVRAFDRQDFERARFGGANLDLTGLAIRVNRIMGLLFPGLFLIMNITSVAVIWFGAARVDAGLTNVGDLLAFSQYAMQIMFSFFMLSMMFVMLPRAAASAKRINEVLETESSVLEPSVAQHPEPHGWLEFDNATFSHPGAEEPALRGVSFKAGPGEVTAIVGGTGAGKTTLVNLIPRFHDVDSGRVLVDGVDVRALEQHELRARIGFVPQRAVLFKGTVRDNLRFGAEDATDEQLRHALDVAQATDFVETLGGLDAPVAQGGANLSGGQRQRLSIARALARRPSIYVFDDSFSALDFRTDARLRAALHAETAEATVLIVAQRVSTIIDADRIVVLDQGRVAGVGRHAQLLESCAVYREIVESQLPTRAAETEKEFA